jgi:hypothetical protein
MMIGHYLRANCTKARIGLLPHCVRCASNPKVVLFWNMTVTEMNNFEPGSEIDRLEWLSIRDALNILRYRNEKLLLEKITSIEVGA